jgi:hypothetical protein
MEDFRRKTGRASFRPALPSDLSFRRVLDGFGMDPDAAEPPVVPEENLSALSQSCEDGGRPTGPTTPAGHRRAFWEDEAEAESLPLYISAQNHAAFVQHFVGDMFGPFLRKKFKSALHRRLQVSLKRLRAHAAEVPRNVAAGHALGYGPEGIKGNIARLRRALYHADASVGLLSRMPKARFSREDFKVFFGAAARMRNDLLGWISYLRENSSPRE